MAWISQGPRPIASEGNTQGPDGNGLPAVGSIKTVVPHPSNPNIAWIGAINGGIWRTGNVLDPSPTWTALGDTLPSLSIGALALDRANPNTLVAGFGNFSSSRRQGGVQAGAVLSRDGGNTWSAIGAAELGQQNVAGLSISGSTIIVATNRGLYQSNDLGASFQRRFTGNFVSLAADPAQPSVLYAGFLGGDRGGGIFSSQDGGATWQNISPADFPVLSGSTTLKLSVGAGGALYGGWVSQGRFVALGRYTPSEGWRQVAPPAIGNGLSVNPGGQGSIHFSLVADPSAPGVVYIGGDRQPSGQEEGAAEGFFPNSLGAPSYTGILFRGNATTGQWTSITNTGANNTAPHADSRNLAVAANGTLLEVDDGGLYRLTNPQQVGSWSSANGNLDLAEIYSIGFDGQNKILAAGKQDNGSSFYHLTAGNQIWTQLAAGDGGAIAVADNPAQGSSKLYYSSQKLGGFRRVETRPGFSARDAITPKLLVGNNQRIYNVASEGLPFVTPIALNAINSNRLVIGATNEIYESTDSGNTLTQVPLSGGGQVTTFVYGGRIDNQPQPDLLYVGTQAGLFRRWPGQAMEAITSPAAEGASIVALASDPANGRALYASDGTSVYASNDAGTTWQTITGNLSGLLLTQDFKSLAFIRKGDQSLLAVGGTGGVLVTRSPVGQANWSRLGQGLPNTIAASLNYSTTADVLAVGTLGRGAWTLDNPLADAAGSRWRPDAQPRANEPSTANPFIVIGNSIAPENLSDYLVKSDLATIGNNEQVDDQVEVPEMQFFVSLSAPTDHPVTVKYSMQAQPYQDPFGNSDTLDTNTSTEADPNAEADPSEFEVKSGTVTFDQGETEKTISVRLFNNDANQGDKVFYVDLSDAQGGTIADDRGLGNILDDDGPDGNSLRLGSDAPETFAMGAGEDIVSGGPGDDLITGVSGKKIFYGNQGNDTLIGGSDHDQLNGGQGDDLLIGNDGDDLLAGDLGADTLTGGAGSDRFVLMGETSSDTITDFAIGQDRLVLGGGLQAGQVTLNPLGDRTEIINTATGKPIALLLNTVANDLNSLL